MYAVYIFWSKNGLEEMLLANRVAVKSDRIKFHLTNGDLYIIDTNQEARVDITVYFEGRKFKEYIMLPGSKDFTNYLEG